METTPINVRNGDYFFYPINMPVNNGIIKWATATPFCMDGTTLVLYGGEDSVFITEGDPDYRLISREEALNTYKCSDRLVVSKYPIIEGTSSSWYMPVKEEVNSGCKFENIAKGKYRLIINYPENADDWLLRIDYSGESANAYIDGELVADNYYTGPPWFWEISLKHLETPRKMTLEIETLHKHDAIYLEAWPEMKNETINCINSVKMFREVRKRMIL
jgi:hypothetical protein